MGESASTHDPYDPSKKLTHLTHWPMTHRPIVHSGDAPGGSFRVFVAASNPRCSLLTGFEHAPFYVAISSRYVEKMTSSVKPEVQNVSQRLKMTCEPQP